MLTQKGPNIVRATVGTSHSTASWDSTKVLLGKSCQESKKKTINLTAESCFKGSFSPHRGPHFFKFSRFSITRAIVVLIKLKLKATGLQFRTEGSPERHRTGLSSAGGDYEHMISTAWKHPERNTAGECSCSVVWKYLAFRMALENIANLSCAGRVFIPLV